MNFLLYKFRTWFGLENKEFPKTVVWLPLNVTLVCRLTWVRFLVTAYGWSGHWFPHVGVYSTSTQLHYVVLKQHVGSLSKELAWILIQWNSCSIVSIVSIEGDVAKKAKVWIHSNHHWSSVVCESAGKITCTVQPRLSELQFYEHLYYPNMSPWPCINSYIHNNEY